MYIYSSDSLVKPPVLFGRRLLPLTLGHADILHALEHPALTDDVLTLPDMASAVWICSTPWKEAGKKIRSGKFQRQLIGMGRRSRSRKLKAESSQLMALFEEYRQFYIAAPPRWEDNENADPRAPWHLTLFCAIQKNTNLSMDETWNLPIRRAAEICAGLSAIIGDKSLMTPAEQSLEESL